MGLESHIFCYLGRCPNSDRLGVTSNPRLVLEYFISEANTRCLFFESLVSIDCLMFQIIWTILIRF